MGIAPYPPFCVLGYSEAAMLLRAADQPEIVAAICIHGQRDPVLDLECKHRLDLSFDDSPVFYGDDMIANYRRRLQQRTAAEIGLRLSGPEPSHIQQIIEFADRVQSMNGMVLFQCHAGISRSSAAAMICLCKWLGEGYEVKGLEILRQLRPAAHPHRDMIRMADELSGRNGKLVAVINHLF